MHFGFSNDTIHRCPRRCGILHANWQPVKCLARMMQDAHGACATWEAYQAALVGSGTTTSSVSVRTRPARTPAANCANSLGPSWRRGFHRGLKRFFADCCVADGKVGGKTDSKAAASRGWG
jgi:hypothetical protein